ncbi:MAG: SMP-30/gluconolactonase/LRE family protein [Chthoniobacter sp.]
MRAAHPETLINLHCELGENPLWNADDGCVYWTDITGGNIHRFHLATRKHTRIYSGEIVGGFTLETNGDLLLFRVNDIAVLRSDGRLETLRTFADEGVERFNDVIADPEGRVFAGTIGRTSTSGGLFRLERDGSSTLLFRGTGCSNGMGFSPELTQFYWTCSTRRTIFVFDYDRATGGLSGERVFYEAPPSEGIPDGMVVDRTGHVWSARWDGSSIVHHAEDGAVIERIPFPVAQVSSLCFGGPALDQMFVTTAGGVPGSASADGAIYQWKPGVQGLPEFRSRMTG